MRKIILLGLALLIVIGATSAMAQNTIPITFKNGVSDFLDFYVDGQFKCTIGPGAFYTVYVPAGTHVFKACVKGTTNCITYEAYVDDVQGYTWTISPK